jgi:hypothetical protein
VAVNDASDTTCSCWLFDRSEVDGDVAVCECGHTDDEHDRTGVCQAEPGDPT